MDDIRKLLRDDEADISPETLSHILRGLNATLHDLVRDGAPSEPRARQRYTLSIEAACCAEMVSLLLSRSVDFLPRDEGPPRLKPYSRHPAADVSAGMTGLFFRDSRCRKSAPMRAERISTIVWCSSGAASGRRIAPDLGKIRGLRRLPDAIERRFLQECRDLCCLEDTPCNTAPRVSSAASSLARDPRPARRSSNTSRGFTP